MDKYFAGVCVIEDWTKMLSIQFCFLQALTKTVFFVVFFLSFL